MLTILLPRVKVSKHQSIRSQLLQRCDNTVINYHNTTEFCMCRELHIDFTKYKHFSYFNCITEDMALSLAKLTVNRVECFRTSFVNHLFFISFFASGVGFPLYPEIFYFITMILQRIRIIVGDPDSNPESNSLDKL